MKESWKTVPYRQSVATYVLFLVFSSLQSFPSITCYYTAVTTRDAISNVSPFLRLFLCRIFLHPLTTLNTSFCTRSAQSIYSIIFQHHISKPSKLVQDKIVTVQNNYCSVS